VPTDFFEGAAMLFTFILLGKFLEARASAQTCRKLTSLMTLAPEHALLVDVSPHGSVLMEQLIDSRLIHTGDTLLIKPGAQVPTDGTIMHVRFWGCPRSRLINGGTKQCTLS
jgi:cation transport ATPase